MSMREYPQSGYVVPLDAFKSLLSEEKQEEFDRLVEGIGDGDIEETVLVKFLMDNVTPKLPPFDLYRPAAEDTVDDPMEEGVYCAIFDEDDLYVKKETPELQAMKKLGIEPTFTTWSVWGRKMNRVYLEVAEVDDNLYEVKVYDDYDVGYMVFHEKPPDSDVDLLRLVKQQADEEADLSAQVESIRALLDYVEENSKGVYIRDTYYDYEEIVLAFSSI